MQITNDLRLVVPIKTDDAGLALVWGYHVPITREVYQAHYRIIAATKAALFNKGIGYALDLGPATARLALLDAARDDAAEHGLEESQAPILLAEIARLTTVVAGSKEAGYKPIPSDNAIANNIISAEEWEEAVSALVFFTSAYWTSKSGVRAKRARRLASALQGSMTSSTLTEFAASLLTSTPEKTSEPIPA